MWDTNIPQDPNDPNSSIIYIGTIDDLPGGTNTSFASGINNHEQVVGESTTTGGRRGFYWDPNSGLIELSELPGGDERSEALRINDQKQIVGASHGADGKHAVIWNSSLQILDLGDLPGGAVSALALDINKSSIIVGESETAQGRHAFIWDNFNGMRDLNELISSPLYCTLLFTKTACTGRWSLALTSTTFAPVQCKCWLKRI